MRAALGVTLALAGVVLALPHLNNRQVSNDNVAYITDPNTYCMILPRFEHVDVGASEYPGGMKTFCSPNGIFDRNAQGENPQDFWSNVEMSTAPGINGARRVQLTGCIRPELSTQLNPTDGGGQYDSSGGEGGLGNPQGSVCLGYNHYVELVEPAGRRACIRCCDDPADCPLTMEASYLAFDIIGDLALGLPFGLIQTQKDSSLSIESVGASGDPQRGTVEIPVVKTIAGTSAMSMGMGLFPSWTHRFLQLLPWNLAGLFDTFRFFKLTKISVNARLKRGPRKNLDDGKQSIDLIDKLLEVKNEDGSPLSIHELYAEAVLLLIAGSDTTSNTLSSLCYHLAIDPELQQRLQAELDKHIPYDSSDEPDNKEGLAITPHDAIANYDDIKSLPYLNACVKEALRIHSTVGTGLPRVVPPGKTITIRGQTFKAGSVISVPSYTTNRMSVWGDDAEAFRPERWLDDHTGSLNKYFVPFSVGPRACMGRNLAYMDLMLIAATIFRRYRLEALTTTKMIVHETFAREAAQCEIAIKLRDASNSG